MTKERLRVSGDTFLPRREEIETLQELVAVLTQNQRVEGQIGEQTSNQTDTQPDAQPGKHPDDLPGGWSGGAFYLVDEENQVKSRLPREVYRLLLKAIIALSQGRAISVTPLSTRLSTQQAADFLGVSRPTLVRLLDEGEIPYSRPRRHRQVLLADLLEYDQRHQYRAARALDEITADTARMGFYDAEFAR